MVRRMNVNFALLCIVVLSLALTVSCAKQPPETAGTTDEPAVSESRMESETGMEQGAEEEADISEQELEARQQAAMAKEQFLSEKVYFKFDDSSLTAEARDVLRKKVQWLRNHPDACVIIEGHCDERGTDEYNLALGSRRAESVKDFLVKAGIDGSDLTTISYGEERPAVRGHNEEAWAKNRRAEFRFCNE